LKIEYVSNSETEGNLKTETIEKMEMIMTELELKLHVSFIIEVNELITALTSLTEDFDKIKNATIFQQFGQMTEILSGESKETFEQDGTLFERKDEKLVRTKSGFVDQSNEVQDESRLSLAYISKE
jgi:hypothetical protein